jgi:uncharacterized protein YndB with AHSA1/START domain
VQVVIEKVFEASPERLYGIWTDPSQISQWFGCTTTIEPKVGGSLRFEFPREPDATTGKFQELEPFSKIVFTWSSFNHDSPTGETLVTITIEEVDSRQSKIKLIHSGFQSDVAVKEHTEGWNYYFDTWSQKIVS